MIISESNLLFFISAVTILVIVISVLIETRRRAEDTQRRNVNLENKVNGLEDQIELLESRTVLVEMDGSSPQNPIPVPSILLSTSGSNSATQGNSSGGPIDGFFTSPAAAGGQIVNPRIRVTWGGRDGQPDRAIENSLGPDGEFEAILLIDGQPFWSSGPITASDENMTTISPARYGGGGLGIDHYFKDFFITQTIPAGSPFGSRFTWSNLSPEFKGFFIQIYSA